MTHICVVLPQVRAAEIWRQQTRPLSLVFGGIDKQTTVVRFTGLLQLPIFRKNDKQEKCALLSVVRRGAQVGQGRIRLGLWRALQATRARTDVVYKSSPTGSPCSRGGGPAFNAASIAA